jgi:hypothetical protein
LTGAAGAHCDPHVGSGENAVFRLSKENSCQAYRAYNRGLRHLSILYAEPATFLPEVVTEPAGSAVRHQYCGHRAMNSYDGTTLATYTIVVFLLRKLQAKGLMSAGEVADLIDSATREFEAEGLDNITIKAGHRLLQDTKKDLAEPSHAISRRAA